MPPVLRIKKTVCPVCGSSQKVEDITTGEILCGKCGAILEERTPTDAPDWRNEGEKDKSNDRRHTGGPLTLTIHDYGLSSIIAPSNRDIEGGPLTPSIREEIRRLRTWDKRSILHESANRNMNQAFLELSKLVEKLHLNNAVAEHAAYIYRHALEKGIIRGRLVSLIIAASLYVAIRTYHVPITLKELARASQFPKKELARAFRLLIKELDLKLPIPSPLYHLTKIISALNLSEKVRRRAAQLIQFMMQKDMLVGKDPAGLAASAVYAACLLEEDIRSQREIAVASSITEVTVRNRFRHLYQVLKKTGHPDFPKLERMQHEILENRYETLKRYNGARKNSNVYIPQNK